MKIAISATGRDTDSNIDKTFGRAPFFLIVDTKTQEKKVVINKVRDRETGVGVVVDNIIANEEIDAVITNNIGPFAYETFEQCGIKIYQAEGKIGYGISFEASDEDYLLINNDDDFDDLPAITIENYNKLESYSGGTMVGCVNSGNYGDIVWWMVYDNSVYSLVMNHNNPG